MVKYLLEKFLFSNGFILRKNCLLAYDTKNAEQFCNCVFKDENFLVMQNEK